MMQKQCQSKGSAYLMMMVCSAVLILTPACRKEDAQQPEPKKLTTSVQVSNADMKKQEEEYKQINALIRNKEYDKAIEFCVKITEQDPHDWGKMVVIGECYMRKGDFKKAEEYLQKAVAVNPQGSFIYLMYGNLYVQKQDFAKAEEYLKKCVGLSEDRNSEARNCGAYANFFLQIKDFKNAKEYAERALRIDPQNENFSNLLNAALKGAQ